MENYLMGLFFGFLMGYGFSGFKNEKKPEKKTVPELYLHCFECEFEMPVKEKNGQMYCSNCGLRH